MHIEQGIRCVISLGTWAIYWPTNRVWCFVDTALRVYSYGVGMEPQN